MTGTDYILTPELWGLLVNNGYEMLFEIKGKGVCGIKRFAFTTGLVVGLDQSGYKERYCYKNRIDAIYALIEWQEMTNQRLTVAGDPEDEEWIVYKGPEGDRPNPKNDKYNPDAQ